MEAGVIVAGRSCWSVYPPRVSFSTAVLDSKPKTYNISKNFWIEELRDRKIYLCIYIYSLCAFLYLFLNLSNIRYMILLKYIRGVQWSEISLDTTFFLVSILVSHYFCKYRQSWSIENLEAVICRLLFYYDPKNGYLLPFSPCWGLKRNTCLKIISFEYILIIPIFSVFNLYFLF